MDEHQNLERRRRRRKWVAAAAFVLAVLGAVGWKLSVGQELLLRAAHEGNPLQARILLAFGVDPDGREVRSTPLGEAVYCCRPEVVRLLLEHRADPRHADRDRIIPLHRVRDDCPVVEQLVDMLAAAGADFRACPPRRSAILSFNQGVKSARALLKHGADPSQSCPDDFGNTPLHSYADQPEMVALLLQHGAKIVANTSVGWTPLHRAANLGRKDYESQIPGRLKSAELLLEHGADVNAVDQQGRTALDLAYEHGDKEMAAILLKHGGKSHKHESLEAGEAARDSENEYRELFSVAEGVRRGPACSLDMHGDNRAIMEEGPNWSIVQGTVGVVKVNCHAAGYFHYAVLGMGSPVPKRLNMPLPSGMGGSERITFDAPWSNGAMHWYYSRERITNLVRALSRGDASHFAVRYVNVGK